MTHTGGTEQHDIPEHGGAQGRTPRVLVILPGAEGTVPAGLVSALNDAGFGLAGCVGPECVAGVTTPFDLALLHCDTEDAPACVLAIEAALGARPWVHAPLSDTDGNLARLLLLREARALSERRRTSRALSRVRAQRATLLAQTDALTGQIRTLCEGFADAARAWATGTELASLRAEFNALVRQELELESLLRTTLEFTLRRVGPTNGAIFLPSSCGDYSLGAYINYDCPKETAETLLEQLAGVLAPACEGRRGLTLAARAAELNVPGLEEQSWLTDAAFAVRACWHEDECIAVVALFRDRRTPFAESQRAALTAITDLFCAQLARVIRTHHRHKPVEQWGPENC
ncbi:MAG: hypothetical protein KF864_01190 [Phycisphaeraceae bacterium]|nr:hypothetical protein [Phycisphaeraceae bacterium]